MSELNKKFPEILLAYIGDVGCEFSNSRLNELSKFVSELELEIASLTAENARLIEENTKWKRLVDMKNDALDSYAEFYNSCLSVCGMDVDTNPCTEADERILETLRKGVKDE